MHHLHPHSSVSFTLRLLPQPRRVLLLASRVVGRVGAASGCGGHLRPHTAPMPPSAATPWSLHPRSTSITPQAVSLIADSSKGVLRAISFRIIFHAALTVFRLPCQYRCSLFFWSYLRSAGFLSYYLPCFCSMTQHKHYSPLMLKEYVHVFTPLVVSVVWIALRSEFNFSSWGNVSFHQRAQILLSRHTWLDDKKGNITSCSLSL